MLLLYYPSSDGNVQGDFFGDFKYAPGAGASAPRHLPPQERRRRPRCPLATARATRLAFRLVTPNAGRVVSPTTPRCVLGRSSYSPLTQRSRSAAPRLTRLTPARASRLTPVTPRSPPARAIAPHHHTNHHTQPIHEPDTKLMASHSHSPRCRPCPEAAMMVRPANVRMHRACSFWFKTLTLILTSSPAPAAASILSSRALPDRAPHRSDFVRCAPPVPALSRLARRAGSSSAPSTNRLRQTLCRCGILAEPQLSSI
eukprot:scaffold120395_cov54-Phaeocystis_antarctica.AAC.2